MNLSLSDIPTPNRTGWEELTEMLCGATGGDPEIDRACHNLAGGAGEPLPYSEDVGTAILLAERLLPTWKWHLGYGARGIFPYAVLSKGASRRFEGNAPTVPLALLLALAQAMSREEYFEAQRRKHRNSR